MVATNAWEGGTSFSSSAGYSTGYCTTWYKNGARCVHTAGYSLPAGKSSSDYETCPTDTTAAIAHVREVFAKECIADSECVGYYYGGTYQGGVYGALCKASKASYPMFSVTVSSNYVIDVKCFQGETSSRWVADCGAL